MRKRLLFFPFLLLLQIFTTLSCDKLKKEDDEEEDDEITEEVMNSPINKLFYGNWCGPLKSGPEDALDSLDACCKTHDTCYDGMGDDLNYFQCHKPGAKADCDNTFVACLKALADTPSSWPSPPSKVEDAGTYKKEATLIFDECAPE